MKFSDKINAALDGVEPQVDGIPAVAEKLTDVLMNSEHPDNQEFTQFYLNIMSLRLRYRLKEAINMTFIHPKCVIHWQDNGERAYSVVFKNYAEQVNPHTAEFLVENKMIDDHGRLTSAGRELWRRPKFSRVKQLLRNLHRL